MDEKLEKLKEKARKLSIEENCTIHVNVISDDKYEVGDWFDFNQTVASYENGVQIF